MRQITAEQQAMVFDAADNLLGAIRTVVATNPDAPKASANDLEAAVVTMAVQAVFMGTMHADVDASGFYIADIPRFKALFLGLGAGVGQVLGCVAISEAQDAAFDSYCLGLARTLGSRTAKTQADWVAAGRPGAKGSQP